QHDLAHMVERVLRELRYQAANLVALGPGRIVAYEENEHTLAGLAGAGVDIATTPGWALSAWNGGPHCLTLPLSRGGT
ncbi:MAG: hypothetical protein LC713_00475, partial [Actinobacteria bacterium]|nr:hypothetical protein [Actinomycetota bacterium]